MRLKADLAGDSVGGMCETSSWHGTMTATLLACDPARSNVDPPFQGALPGAVQILPVRVLGACKRGYASDVADAIVWAAGGNIQGLDQHPSHRPSIILMPFSGYFSGDEESQPKCPSYLQSAVRLAASKNITLIASGGNNYGESASNYFPANCDGVMSVGALNRQGEMAAYSNTDTHIHMPGGDASDPLACMSRGMVVRPCMGTSFAATYAAAWAASIILERGYFEIPSERKPPGLLAFGQALFPTPVPNKDTDAAGTNWTNYPVPVTESTAEVEGDDEPPEFATCRNLGYETTYYYSRENKNKDCAAGSCRWGRRTEPFNNAYSSMTISFKAYDDWGRGYWYMDEFCTPLPGYYASGTAFCSTKLDCGWGNYCYENGDARPNQYCYRQVDSQFRLQMTL